jgi:hypothetical protein
MILAAILFAGTAAAQTPEPTPQPASRAEPADTGISEPNPTPAQTDPATLKMLEAVHDGLTIDELAAIMNTDGYGVTVKQGEGNPYLSAGTVNGVSYDVWLTECDQAAPARCIGLTAQTYSFNESPKVTLKALNDWNANTWGMRAMMFADGQSAIAMNIGLNGGITGNWVLKRLRNFNYWAEAYNAFWKSGDPKAVLPE